MYINFYIHKEKSYEPDPGRRRELRNHFRNFTNVYDVVREDYFSFMNNLGNSKFVMCPQGFGLDTYRYWEAILMGAIPIVQNSTLNSLFTRSTTLVLNDLKDLTQDMLDNPHLYIKDMRNEDQKCSLIGLLAKRVEFVQELNSNLTFNVSIIY